MIHLLHGRQVDRYFAGMLPPAAVSDLFQRLWQCAACRARYERHLLDERTLPDGRSLAEARLWRSIVACGRADAHAVRAPRREAAGRLGVLQPLALLVGGALAVALFLAPRGVPVGTGSAPVARGAAQQQAAAPSLHLFRTVGGHETEPIEHTMRAGDGVLIAYSNPGSELSYLMVFAVDGRGNVYWYYPPYEQPSENPAAPAIRRHALGVELGEEIHHALPPGSLRMFALFLPRPLLVGEVERVVAHAWAAGGQSLGALQALPIGEGQQLSRLLEVTP